MKTLFVSLAALLAVSGAALAEKSSRSSDTYFGKYATQNKAADYATDSNALTIINGSKKKSAFERMNEISEEGGKDYGRGHDHDVKV
jgi:hypothetical protein